MTKNPEVQKCEGKTWAQVGIKPRPLGSENTALIPGSQLSYRLHYRFLTYI